MSKLITADYMYMLQLITNVNRLQDNHKILCSMDYMITVNDL
jgi:hypothetical protein